MKKFLLTLVGVICSLGMWAATNDFTTATKFEASTYANYFGKADGNGIKLTSSATDALSATSYTSIDGTSSTGTLYCNASCNGWSAYDAKYIQIESTKNIKNIKILVGASNENVKIAPVLVGWTSTPSNSAQYYTTSDITPAKTTDLYWMEFNLSSWENIKYIRIYRQVKSSDLKIGETAIVAGNAKTIKVYGIQVTQEETSTNTPSFTTDLSSAYIRGAKRDAEKRWERDKQGKGLGIRELGENWRGRG